MNGLDEYVQGLERAFTSRDRNGINQRLSGWHARADGVVLLYLILRELRETRGGCQAGPTAPPPFSGPEAA